MLESLKIIRFIGVVLGIAFLALSVIWSSEGLPSAYIGIWMTGITSLIVLGVLLVLPWSKIVKTKFWWIPFSLMFLCVLGVAAMLVPNIVWANIHGAWGLQEMMLLTVTAGIIIAQIIAIVIMRMKNDSRNL